MMLKILQQMHQGKTHLHCISDIKENNFKKPSYHRKNLFMIMMQEGKAFFSGQVSAIKTPYINKVKSQY